MAKSKKVIQEAAETFVDLPEEQLQAKLTELGFSEAEIDEVKGLISEAKEEAENASGKNSGKGNDKGADKKDAKSKKGAAKPVAGGINKLYNEVRLVKEAGQLREAFVLRPNVKIDPARADRLNLQSHNSMVRYALVPGQED